MLRILKKLTLGVSLIAAASAVLLMSDLKQWKAGGNKVPRVAILNYATRPVLEDGQNGILDAFKDHGFINGENIEIKLFNAENDLPTANTMASAIIGGNFDLVVSISTPCLQAMASANRNGTVKHIFGVVTDPFGAGVGISPTDPLDHPAHLAGIGTFQPVKEAFEIAIEMCPEIKKVGVVWNPAEACSEACTIMARKTCETMGIELLEATVDNSSGVLEAARALTSRNVDCIWIGGDNTVELAISSLIKATSEIRVPVFANAPSSADSGAIFGLGANYYEVGKITGDLAAQAVKGLDLATVRIENVAPERLAINYEAAKDLRSTWRFTERIKKLAESGNIKDDASASKSRFPGRKLHFSFVHYVESPTSEATERGFLQQLEKIGLKKGVDYDIKIRSSQRDMATLMAIMDAVASEKPDALITSSTPTLQAALKKITNIPIIFGTVASPVIAGAGKSFEDHLPNTTGISTMSAFEDMVAVLKECIPNARRIGTLFVPAEINSVYYKEALEKAARNGGLELITVGVSTSTEVPDATLSLIGKGVDVICQISDNLNNSAFSGITKAAEKTKTPLFAFVTSHVISGGAAVALARDYDEGGRDVADMLIRVMNGESPKNIPFAYVTKTRLVINLNNAATYNLKIPAGVLEKADTVIDLSSSR
ncbi:MAG: ABC transporter substrate-binding protein [Phycisphaeraceae bacterium]|nr:ABC transporter substrate-binding protein [Phycisphaeraceae bacterium]